MYCSPSSPQQPSPFAVSFGANNAAASNPLLKLMSLSATLNNFHQNSEMLLKSPLVPKVPSPKGGGGENPNSPRSGRVSPASNNNNEDEQTLKEPRPPENEPEHETINATDDNDEDEVLSIGDKEIANLGEDEELLDSASLKSGKTLEVKGEESDEEDRLSQKSQFSQANRSSRNSSEDSFSIKSLCSPTPTISSTISRSSRGSPTPQGDNSSQASGSSSAAAVAAASHSLLFSIANILRPDFGLGGTSPSPFVPQRKSIKSPPISYSNKGHANLYKPYSLSSPYNTNGSPIDLSSGNHQISKVKKVKSLPMLPLLPPAHKKPHPPGNGHDKKSGNGTANNNNNKKGGGPPSGAGGDGQTLWPAWVYCTRYSDRPSSGPRARRERKNKEKEIDEKRPRTAFTAEQLARLKKEFEENRYLTEKRRQDLARELRLHENQIKIWFQNKRAKLKKASGSRGGLALQLMAQGLYNHSTISKSGGEDEDSD